MGALKKGDKGPKVKALQQKLIKAGVKPKVDVTAKFDDKTDEAVRAFQKKAKLKVDGKVGTKTMEAFEFGDKPPKWTLKDTVRGHKQINDKIATLKKERVTIAKLAKKHPKDKRLKEAFRGYNIYADALAKQMQFIKDELERVDFCKGTFDGHFGDGPKEKVRALKDAQDIWKTLEKRNKDAAKLEKYYDTNHDAFLEALDNVPA